jgi:zinc finger HIT domain-containing protein 1
MGKIHDAKKGWMETIAKSHGVGVAALRKKKKKRVSERTTKISKAMKYVDQETRNIVRNARLDALEADNFGEEENREEEDADDVYIDEEIHQTNNTATNPQKRSGSKKAITGGGGGMKKKKKFKVKNLAQLVFEEFGTMEDVLKPPNYWTIAAKASTKPSRHFCCVCGYFAPYTCTRCGSRFCRARCGESHKESGCLKFGL